MIHDLPLAKDVVLVGGGHAHALLLKRWGMSPVPGAQLTVINPAPSAPYTGMLPGYVAGHYGRDDLEIDLIRLARFAGARVILGIVDGIDRNAKRISLPGRPAIRYDIASIDIGITSNMPEIEGFSEHGVAAKPLGPYALEWRDFLMQPAPGPVTVIGGGLAGVELSLAMHFRLRSEGHAPELRVIEAAEALIGVTPTTRARLLAEMDKAGIALFENARVTKVEADHITLGDGRRLPSAFTTGAAGARPFEWVKETGLDLVDGYIAVGPDLSSVNDPAIFAAGDCAHLTHAPRPKAGVFAVREAPILTHNIQADLTGRPRKVFKPQDRYLKLVSLGGKSAIADRGKFAPAGPLVWRWKDWIDQKFMQSLDDLTPMAPPVPPRDAAKAAVALRQASKPLCGACGAKVSSERLEAALAPLGNSAIGDDAAVLTMGGTQQVISTDHLRAFWNDPYLAAKISLCHALGDVWAMGATPQAVLAQITLPQLAPDLQAAWLDDITAGASEIAQAAGAEIVGGHTATGAELTLGFTVTGLLDRPAKTLRGAQPGDALILTHAIGTGVILAAEMALTARGTDVRAALDQMATPKGDAAKALSAATAMTDVTGFGLAGHLARMTAASGTGTELNLDRIPLLEGALHLSQVGTRSSLFADNAAVLPDLAESDDPKAALLFDPQTSGGFLASVPADQSDAVLEALRKVAPDAAIIGRITEGSGITLA